VLATQDIPEINVNSHNAIQKIQRIQWSVQETEIVIHSIIVHATVDILEINVNVWETIVLAILDIMEIDVNSHNALERILQTRVFVLLMVFAHL
jgi:hypothetical protein